MQDFSHCNESSFLYIISSFAVKAIKVSLKYVQHLLLHFPFPSSLCILTLSSPSEFRAVSQLEQHLEKCLKTSPTAEAAGPERARSLPHAPALPR